MSERKHSRHFFARQPDGTVKLRMKFSSDEAALFEEAAGDTPVMLWMHRTLGDAARRQVRARRAKLPKIAPPNLDAEGSSGR